MQSFRYVAPAGAPIRLSDLVRAAGCALGSRDRIEASLTAAIRAKFQVSDAFLTVTGRAGLTVLLKALRRLGSARRDEVILPSYTCYSVGASVVKAGLRPRLVDISSGSLGYDTDKLASADFSRVLAVVATNLYGYADDLRPVIDLARAHGAFVIDDAAQAMGARRDGAAAGTRGDAGLFSFDKGKNVSAIDGGVVVTNSPDVASAMREETALLGAGRPGAAVEGVVKALVYWAMLRPAVYWIPNMIPQLGLGRTVFTTEFPLTRPSRALAALAISTLGHLEEFTAARRRNAAALSAGFAGVASIRPAITSSHNEAACLRFPILMSDRQSRDHALRSLNAAGIGASGSYPASLADVPDLRPVLVEDATGIRAGRAVAERILTLPTHPFVTNDDISRMVGVVAATIAPAQRGMGLCVE